MAHLQLVEAQAIFAAAAETRDGRAWRRAEAAAPAAPVGVVAAAM